MRKIIQISATTEAMNEDGHVRAVLYGLDEIGNVHVYRDSFYDTHDSDGNLTHNPGWVSLNMQPRKKV